MQIPTNEQFFNRHGQDQSKPDIAFLKNHFYREGRLSEEQALWILETATEVLRKEGNVLQVDAPITGTPILQPISSSTTAKLSFRQSVAISMVNMYVRSPRHATNVH